MSEYYLTNYDEMAQIEDLALQMYRRLEQTGQPSEQRWKEDLKLILRLTPEQDHIQLLAVGTYRQASTNERGMIREAFDVPDEIRPEFRYQRGYGFMSWIYPITLRPGLTIPQQITLWDLHDYLADNNLEIVPNSFVWDLGMTIPTIRVKPRRQEGINAA